MQELKNRDAISTEYKWNLTTIFASDTAWEAAFEIAEDLIVKADAYVGQISKSAESLLACLEFRSEFFTAINKLYVYAKLSHDADTTDPVYQAMHDKAMSLVAKLQAATGFIFPEIIAAGEDMIHGYVENHDGLKPYRHFLEDLFRKQKHILPPENETLLMRAAEIGQAPGVIYAMIHDADMVFPNAVDSEGREHIVNHVSSASLAESPDRVLRESAVNAMDSSFAAQINTIATVYNYVVKNNNFMADVRNHENALSAALYSDNLPQEIYTNLIATVNKNGLPLFHRYLKLRKKFLGLDELRMHDMRVSMVENADTYISWEDAKSTVFEGLAALGTEYQALVKKGLNDRWIDVYGNKGKYRGGYCLSSYSDPHPFILLNFDNTINYMFNLAHEMGHALHSYYTHKNQPAVYGYYTVFLAEIASTVNEVLLIEHLLNNTTNKTKYNYLLYFLIQQFNDSLFAQTRFAEFEMLAHEMADRGEPLTADTLGKLYRGIADKYYGDAGVVLDENINNDWSQISHLFWYNYHVYKYATGFSAAMAFAKKIREEGAPAVERYLNFLKSGSKDYSINLLKEAGLDMTTPQPINDALEIFEDLLNKFEKANFNDE